MWGRCLPLYVALSIFLLVFVEGTTCPSLEFQSSVNVKCIQYPDVEYGTHYIKVTISSLIDYKVTNFADGREGIEPLTVRIESFPNNIPQDYPIVQDPQTYAPNQLVGVALDGIPIYSSLSTDMVDVVATGAIRIDNCGGTFGPTADGIRYHYRVMPTCIHSGLRRVNNTQFTLALDEDDKVKRRRLFISDTHELLQYFEKDDGFEDGPALLGYALSGHPIYSPLDYSGALHADVDSCNGKFGDDGKYGYYTRPTFPYIIGCDGPGLFSMDFFDNFESFEALGSVTNVVWNACPGGFQTSTAYEGGCEPCPAGRYSPNTAKFIPGGDIDEISSQCGRICPIGHYCPSASTRPLKCPGGRYGSSLGLENEYCSGECTEGYFCPAGSVSPQAFVCGSQNYFCPIGSAVPRLVDAAYYTSPESSDFFKRSAQEICPPSNYCEDGLKIQCPPGTFGNSSGISTANCTASCPLGHFCLEGSVNPTKCPAGRYGSNSGLSSPECSGPCQRGYWCPEGSISKYEVPCAAGKYGSVEGLVSEQCVDPLHESCEVVGGPNSTSSSGTKFCIEDNICAAGYYCPEASVRPDQVPCGGANYYCPPGSALPRIIDDGFYSTGPASPARGKQSPKDHKFRHSFAQCEEGYWCLNGIKTLCSPGKYGGVRGLSDEACSGPCSPGYICDAGSWTATQWECGRGPEVYCIAGSFESVTAPAGYYTVNGSLTTRSAILPCPPGTYCVDGIKRMCPPGRYSQNGAPSALCDGLCEKGYYCLEGSDDKRQYPCPGGRWGTEGMEHSFCSGSCESGYFCPTNSTSSRQFACGGESFYCPPGMPAPLPVDSGYYSTGGSSETRSGQLRCESTLPASVLGEFCYARSDIVCYSEYGYNMLHSLQRGYWDGTGTWISNFWDSIVWRITQDGRYCHDRASDDRTNTLIVGGSHCSSSEPALFSGDPPAAKITVHICPDTTMP